MALPALYSPTVAARIDRDVWAVWLRAYAPIIANAIRADKLAHLLTLAAAARTTVDVCDTRALYKALHTTRRSFPTPASAQRTAGSTPIASDLT